MAGSGLGEGGAAFKEQGDRKKDQEEAQRTGGRGCSAQSPGLGVGLA